MKNRNEMEGVGLGGVLFGMIMAFGIVMVAAWFLEGLSQIKERADKGEPLNIIERGPIGTVSLRVESDRTSGSFLITTKCQTKDDVYFKDVGEMRVQVACSRPDGGEVCYFVIRGYGLEVAGCPGNPTLTKVATGQVLLANDNFKNRDCHAVGAVYDLSPCSNSNNDWIDTLPEEWR